jgi:hypothetical protein
VNASAGSIRAPNASRTNHSKYTQRLLRTALTFSRRSTSTTAMWPRSCSSSRKRSTSASSMRVSSRWTPSSRSTPARSARSSTVPAPPRHASWTCVGWTATTSTSSSSSAQWAAARLTQQPMGGAQRVGERRAAAQRHVLQALAHEPHAARRRERHHRLVATAAEGDQRHAVAPMRGLGQQRERDALGVIEHRLGRERVAVVDHESDDERSALLADLAAQVGRGDAQGTRSAPRRRRSQRRVEGDVGGCSARRPVAHIRAAAAHPRARSAARGCSLDASRRRRSALAPRYAARDARRVRDQQSWVRLDG